MKECKLITAYGFREDGSAYRAEMIFYTDTKSVEEAWTASRITLDVRNRKEAREIIKALREHIEFQFNSENKAKIGASHGKKRKIGE